MLCIKVKGRVMTNLKLFDLLPNGVIVLKNQKIEYINQHLLDILNTTFLDKEGAIDILLKTLNVQNDKELFSFCNNHDYFIRGSKVIQIEHNSYGEYDFFSFVRINPLLVAADLNKKEQKKSKEIYIDKKVAKFFKLNNIKKVHVWTSYKGLPLKNFGNIIKVSAESIVVEVDLKHRISLLYSDDILLIANTKKGTSVLHGHVVDSKDNLFTIKNFVLSKNDRHMREGIRIKTFDEMQVIVDEEKYKVYDISQKGVSISIDDQVQEEFLKNKASMKIIYNDEILPVNVKYLKTIYENDEILKIVFLMFTSDESSSIIHDYLNKKQNEIIREIHNYRNEF